MRLFLLLAGAVSLYAQTQTCTYTVTPTSVNVAATPPAGAGPFFSETIQVTPAQSCSTWTATSNAPWLQITTPQNYVGPQTVNYTIYQNTSQAVRTGTIMVGDANMQQTVTITQAALSCVYYVTPPTASLPVGGGAASFQVTTGCNWSVSPSVGWIRITSPAGSTLGNGTVSYTAAPNSCATPRNGSVIVNTGGATPSNPTFTVTEVGSPNNLSFSGASASYPAAAATALHVAVATGQGCPWSATSDVSWLQITSSSGNGPGAVIFSITENVGPQRVGHISIGTQVFTVTEAGATAAPAPALSAIVNSASGRTGPLAPGEIVSLFGSYLGPAIGVPFAQTITTTLGGVQVMFGNLPAPLTYVIAGQINAVVPYGVAGGTTVPVEVQYSGQTSNALTATVQPAAPGIFSADMTGAGGGAILNQDYTLNTSANPAAIGSVVMIYGTGGGVTNPPSADGSMAPVAEPFARLALQPVTATIGGVPAQVSYSGGAPGLISGLTQFNVTIPAGVTPGSSVPVLVSVGGYQSQSGLTIAIH